LKICARMEESAVRPDDRHSVRPYASTMELAVRARQTRDRGPYRIRQMALRAAGVMQRFFWGPWLPVGIFSEILVDKRTRTGHFALRKILLMELDRCWRS